MPKIKGDGTITLDRKHRRATVRWSYTENGQRRWLTKVFEDCGTMAEAREAASRYRQEFNNGLDAGKSRMTVREYSERWLADRKHDAERTTMVYGISIRHFCEHIGDVRLEDVNPSTVRLLESRMRRAGNTEGVIDTTRSRLHQIIRDAVLSGALPYDPISVMKPLKVTHTRREALEASEASRLQREAMLEEDGRAAALVIGVSTGARISEVLGMTWGDVVFDVEVGGHVLASINIDKQRAATGKRLVKTKTEASNRTVWVDSRVNEWLRWWKGVQGEKMAAMYLKQTDDTPVCTGSRLQPISKNTWYTWFDGWKVRHGFEDVVFHQLRHTMATLKLANGVDVMSVAASGGWSSGKMVLDRYGHAVTDKVALSAAVLGESLAVPDSGL